MIELIVVICSLVFAAIVVLLSWRSQQRTVRRVAETVERLGDSIPRRARPDAAIDRLTQSVERVRRIDDDVRLADIRIERTLDELDEGIVICDASGAEVTRNASARVYAEARHGEALVEAAIHELLAEALQGTRNRRSIELHAPPRSLEVRAAPLLVDGELIGAMALIDDVTEQKRIAAVRRDFVANVSHELKTPIGALALLAETLADESDPTVIKRLSSHLRDESFRVSRIVDDLLTLSRIEGDGSAVRTSVPVAAIVDEAVARVRPVAERRGVELDVGPIDPDADVVCDRSQLTSALFNLLDNAVKYSEGGSSVLVRVETTPATMSVSVQDHGIGIPTRDLERIFERFYRVDKARSRETGGTGLGLSIVRHVAQNHGGEVSVTSREGEGSTFVLTIPREGS
ncbi:MAG TPA: ATP-binding protein [Acidimicrobiales bacterium]